MPPPRVPVVLSAAARVLSRAAAIVSEDAAAAAGPLAVRRAKDRGRARAAQAAARQQQADQVFRPPLSAAPSSAAAYSASASAAGPSSPSHAAPTPPRWSDLSKAAAAEAAEEDDCPSDMTAYTRFSLSDPLDYVNPPKSTVEVRRPKRPAEPVFVGADKGPADLNAYTPFSLSDPLDYDMGSVRQVTSKRAPRWSDLSKAAAAEDDEDCPHDMTAATAFSLSDPLDYDKPRPPKPQRQEAPPVFVGKEDSRGPTDMTAATMYSMSDPLDYDMKDVRHVRQRRLRWSDLGKAAAAEEAEDCPHDMTAATRFSLSDPLDYNSPPKPTVEVPRPKRPEFKPVFVGKEDGMSSGMDEMTRYSLSDPLDVAEDVRKGKVMEVKRATRPANGVGNAMSDPLNAEFSRREMKQGAPVDTPAVEPTVKDSKVDVGSAAEAKLAPELPALNVDEDDEPVALRASTVPTSRLGRLFHYGSLGASLALGAATESIRRSTGRGGTGSVVMNEANVRRLVATLGRMRGAALKLGQFMSIQGTQQKSPAHTRQQHASS